jgi:hypothetical protein
MLPSGRNRRFDPGTPDSAGFADFPAAILCAVCGRVDCAGCTRAPVVRVGARTPWEAGSGSLIGRLWRTARLATVDGESFFAGLGDGSMTAAFTFAVVCEFLAIASIATVCSLLAYAFAPGFVAALLADGPARRMILTTFAIGIPTVTFLMVAIHALWAGGLELGLRFAGAEGQARHCLRYALYSCGWDLVTSPFGFFAGCVGGGFAMAAAELRAAVRVPRPATFAYVGRARGMTAARSRRALLVAGTLTGSVVLFCVGALGVTVVVAMM